MKGLPPPFPQHPAGHCVGCDQCCRINLGTVYRHETSWMLDEDSEFRNIHNIPWVKPRARRSPRVFSLQLNASVPSWVITGWGLRGEGSSSELFCLEISASIFKEPEGQRETGKPGHKTAVA